LVGLNHFKVSIATHVSPKKGKLPSLPEADCIEKRPAAPSALRQEVALAQQASMFRFGTDVLRLNPQTRFWNYRDSRGWK